MLVERNELVQKTPPPQSIAAKLLALSFYYPPANNPRAVQVSRLLRHSDMRTLLVCADYDQPNERMDHVRASEDSSIDKCLRVPYVENGLQKLSSRFAHRFDLLLSDKRPDKYINWKPAVLRAIEKHFATNEKPDLLVTFGSPMSDHVLGLELKKRYGLAWIAHFSDPWVDNIFKNFNWLTRSINLSLERKVMENADRLVFTSEETIELVMAKYPDELRRKARVLPHAYSGHLYPEQVELDDSQITIRYIGDMYGERTPAPLFAALKGILDTEPELLSNVNVEFVGSLHDLKLNEMGLTELPPGLVTFRNTVTYVESLALMSSADGLLVIDAPADVSVFLPSKLVDYVGAARPIFGITPPGTSATLIRELGGWVADPKRPPEIAEQLMLAVAEIEKWRNQRWGKAVVRSAYEVTAVVASLEEMFAQ